MRSTWHAVTLSTALGTLFTVACAKDGDGGGEAGASGHAASGASSGSAGQGGASGGSAGSSAGKGGTAGTGGTSASGGSGASGGSAGSTVGESGSAGSDEGSSGAPSNGSGGTSGMNDCDPRKIMCRRSAPVCEQGEVPSIEGICYGPCVPIASCACSSAEACPLPEMYTCHRSRGRCDYYVR